MRFFSSSLVTVALVLAAAVSVEARAEAETPPQACYSGAYRFADGGFVVISPSDEGALRYRVSDGRIGKLYPDDDHWVMLEKPTQVAQDIRRFVDDKDFPKESVHRTAR